MDLFVSDFKTVQYLFIRFTINKDGNNVYLMLKKKK